MIGFAAGEQHVNWDDDRCWKAGQFYFNRDDRRLLVPKRIGFGRTLNFAQPVSWQGLTRTPNPPGLQRERHVGVASGFRVRSLS